MRSPTTKDPAISRNFLQSGHVGKCRECRKCWDQDVSENVWKCQVISGHCYEMSEIWEMLGYVGIMSGNVWKSGNVGIMSGNVGILCGGGPFMVCTWICFSFSTSTFNLIHYDFIISDNKYLNSKCNFEEKCGVLADQTTGWQISKSKTASPDTGPSGDHTFASGML